MVRLALAAPEDTLELGMRLGAFLQPRDSLLLHGPLGAGKTTLARGLVAAWTGREEETPSPTYTLVQLYEGPRGALWHFDLYRLSDPEDVFELGLEEALAEGLAVIEWPERLGSWRPENRMDVQLSMDGEGRTANIALFGALKERRFDPHRA